MRGEIVDGTHTQIATHYTGHVDFYELIVYDIFLRIILYCMGSKRAMIYDLIVYVIFLTIILAKYCMGSKVAMIYDLIVYVIYDLIVYVIFLTIILAKYCMGSKVAMISPTDNIFNIDRSAFSTASMCKIDRLVSMANFNIGLERRNNLHHLNNEDKRILERWIPVVNVLSTSRDAVENINQKLTNANASTVDDDTHTITKMLVAVCKEMLNALDTITET